MQISDLTPKIDRKMPSKNVIKEYAPDAFYHIYARGASKSQIFLEERDYIYFIGLFDRYLSKERRRGKDGQLYPTYRESISLLSYCLMGNHFHMLVYQVDSSAITKLMHSIMTSYSRYFNLKYKRSGSLFESRYKASHIENQEYLEHISRYIHLNPRSWKYYKYSSIDSFRKEKYPGWLQPEQITTLFRNGKQYIEFCEDYEDHKEMLETVKQWLADGENF